MRNGIMHYLVKNLIKNLVKNLVKLYLLTATFAFSTVSQANQDETIYSIGAFNESEGERSGLELSMSDRSDYFGLRASVALYSGGNNTIEVYESNEYSYLDHINNSSSYQKDIIFSDIYNTSGNYKMDGSYKSYEKNETYFGFSGFFFVHTGQLINPYLGLGFFIGKTQHCTSDEELYDGCVDNFATAVYPEFGVEFNIVNFQITPYIRRYLDTSDSRTSGNVYGINVGMSF